MQPLYPALKPYREFFLSVTHGHSLYVGLYGNPEGVPVAVMHGGPGGGCSVFSPQFFDPNHYHIILMDQRGAGRSVPHAGIEGNTTADLIDDFEALRMELGICEWILFGGSWGATLALAYAQAHPERVQGLILRGIFLGRQKDIDWIFEAGGASRMFPDYWKTFEAPLLNTNAQNSGQMVSEYYKLLCAADELKRFGAAKAWAGWESRIANLINLASLSAAPKQATSVDGHDALALASIESHYFVNQCFFEPNQLLDNMHKISHLPAIIVHGRYDMICPLEQAFEVHELIDKCQLHMVQDAGHSQQEPGIVDALMKATTHAAKYW